MRASPPSLPALVVGTVAHVRHRPRPYEFTHRHSSWLVDLDQPPRLPAPLRVLADVSPRDHLSGPVSFAALKQEVLAGLAAEGVDVGAVERVVMLAHARSLGFVFDPITAFWALASDGRVVATLLEVRNTFGGRVPYVVTLDERGRGRMDKALFVSPFNDLDGWYDVRLQLDEARCGVWIRLDRGEGPVLSASVVGRPVSATTRAVVRDLLRTPLMPMRVWALIHLHALALWAKRLPTYLALLPAAPRPIRVPTRSPDMSVMRKVLEVRVPTRLDATRTYDYLSDFSHAAQWDAGTVSCVRTYGDGGPGTVYRNVSRFAGQLVEIDYTVERAESPVYEVVGRNRTTVSRDAITVTPTPSGGAVVDYRAEFEIKVPWLARPVVGLLLDRLGAATAAKLGATLDAMAT